MANLSDLTLDEIEGRLTELASQESSVGKSLALATDGFKKSRKRGGAAAYKRSWYFEEQMKRFQSQLDSLSAEKMRLAAERERRIAQA